MAITELFVDPSIAGNSGAGSAADPYGDLQHCLDSETFDTVNGHRINITVGDGTAEILAAGLDLVGNFTAGGAPSVTAQLIFQGCKNESPLVANDGDWITQAGIGRIDCNNNQLFAVNSVLNISLRHLEIFGRAGAGYAYLIYLGNYGLLVECEVHTHSGTNAMVRVNSYGIVRRCHFHGMLSAENCCYAGGTATRFEENYIDIAGSAIMAIRLHFFSTSARRNIIRLNGTTDVNGIGVNGTSVHAVANSIWSAAGSGRGISGEGVNTAILNNVVEGFSGVGGVGIEKTTGLLAEFGGNHCYNNAINYDVSVPICANYGDNEDLSGSSPFTDASGQNFTPVDVGNMKQLAFPPSIIAGDAGLTAAMKMWKGALEPAEPAGVGTTVIIQSHRKVR